MDRVESEPATVDYSSNFLRPCLGFLFGVSWQISQVQFMWVLRMLSLAISLIYCGVVGDPPYLGFKSCLLVHVDGDISLLWALLIAWDTCRCKYSLPSLSSDSKTVMMILMLVPAVQACKQSWFWRGASMHLIFSTSDRSGGNGSLTKAVYRDGNTLVSNWWRIR